MRDKNQPYDLNDYTPMQQRTNPYDLSSPVKKPAQSRPKYTTSQAIDQSLRRLQRFHELGDNLPSPAFENVQGGVAIRFPRNF